MIRGTEIIPSRTKILCGGGCTKIEDLLLIMTLLPEFPGILDDSFFSLDVNQANLQRAKKARKGHKDAMVNEFYDRFIDFRIIKIGPTCNSDGKSAFLSDKRRYENYRYPFPYSVKYKMYTCSQCIFNRTVYIFSS